MSPITYGLLVKDESRSERSTRNAVAVGLKFATWEELKDAFASNDIRRGLDRFPDMPRMVPVVPSYPPSMPMPLPGPLKDRIIKRCEVQHVSLVQWVIAACEKELDAQENPPLTITPADLHRAAAKPKLRRRD
jgi:hypothetical protein